MNNLRQTRIGELSALSSGILSSLFPVVAILSYNSMGPITSLAWTTFLSLAFFVGMIVIKKSWKPINSKEVLTSLIGSALIIGVIFYTLFFFGLKYTNAGNAGIISTLEILSSFLLFNVWKKEFIDKQHILGAILMLASAIVILYPNLSAIRTGDFLILLAVFIVPFGNKMQKKARETLSSEQILLVRTIISSPILFLLAHYTGEKFSAPTGATIIILLINGLLLFGLNKILWIEGIHRIGVTKSISLASVSPAFTLLFAFWLLKDLPTISQIIALPMTIMGIYFLTRKTNAERLSIKPAL